MISERDHLLTQYDAAAAAVDKAGEDVFKQQQSQSALYLMIRAKLATAEEAYETQNSQLKQELAALEDWKNQELVDILQEVAECQEAYFQAAQRAFMPLASEFD